MQNIWKKTKGKLNCYFQRFSFSLKTNASSTSRTFWEQLTRRWDTGHAALCIFFHHSLSIIILIDYPIIKLLFYLIKVFMNTITIGIFNFFPRKSPFLSLSPFLPLLPLPLPLHSCSYFSITCLRLAVVFHSNKFSIIPKTPPFRPHSTHLDTSTQKPNIGIACLNLSAQRFQR